MFSKLWNQASPPKSKGKYMYSEGRTADEYSHGDYLFRHSESPTSPTAKRSVPREKADSPGVSSPTIRPPTYDDAHSPTRRAGLDTIKFMKYAHLCGKLHRKLFDTDDRLPVIPPHITSREGAMTTTFSCSPKRAKCVSIGLFTTYDATESAVLHDRTSKALSLASCSIQGPFRMDGQSSRNSSSPSPFKDFKSPKFLPCAAVIKDTSGVQILEASKSYKYLCTSLPNFDHVQSSYGQADPVGNGNERERRDLDRSMQREFDETMLSKERILDEISRFESKQGR